MYGFLQQSLVKLILQDDNGEVILAAIKQELGKSTNASDSGAEGSGLDDFFKHYDDHFSMQFLSAVAKALQLTEEECLRQAGVFAIDTFIDSGFLPVMRSLGKDFFTFLSNLDSMHDNFLGSFPKMKSPSFVPIRLEDGNTMLHYRSPRQVLGPYTGSLIKTTAQRLFGLDIEVDHVIMKGVNRADHDEFLLVMPPEAYPDDVGEADVQTGVMTMDAQMVDTLFPWHFAVDSDLKVRSVGTMLAIRLKEDPIGKHVRDLMYIQRPLQSKLSIEDFQKRGGTPYQFALKDTAVKEMLDVVCVETDLDMDDSASVTSDGSAMTCPFSRRNSAGSHLSSSTVDQRRARAKVKKHVVQLHGQMIQNGDLMMFAGVPMLKSLDHMKAQGVSLSELPVHSHGREVMLGSMMQTLSAKHANIAALELRDLNNDRDEADRARELTGDLLHKILPPVIADALAKGEKAPAETFPACTVLFSDIVGFTTISGSVPPEEVMTMLNDLFARFDELTTVHGVYKVETVGDAYVVSCGAPDPADDHAERMCRFAIDMVRAASNVISPLDGEPLKIRCGLHSGAVMSGVVGDVRPRYCLFGDTVNVASRMESTGLPASIQISYRVVRALPDQDMFNIVTRGRIAVKGKGTMKTFLLLGLNGGLDEPLWPILADRDDKTVEVWQDQVKPEVSGNSTMQAPRPLSRSSRLSEAALKIHEKRLSTTGFQSPIGEKRLSVAGFHGPIGEKRMSSVSGFQSLGGGRWPSPNAVLREESSSNASQY
nr:soluble guanylate cyclase 3 [Choanoeca flexa]|eukprot:TRINITY_DN10473_c0_g1_i5.p1 TRINITY_DN10473_c0_g1~~TRINITY_DN10473_c0_g1_i5.p1  ORF type:complete len:765 (+),score=167.32 TRINITY_DN10473_c0_g1_i5:1388-3682(+)